MNQRAVLRTRPTLVIWGVGVNTMTPAPTNKEITYNSVDSDVIGRSLGMWILRRS
jgi:hypothetical protein